MAPKLPDLGQMIGPLPLGAWVGVVGGGLGLAYLARRGRPAEEPELAEVSSFPATPVTSGPTRLAPAEPAAPGPAPITDNSEWIRAAVTALVVDGYMPLKTQQCLARFLEGVIEAHDPNSCRPIVEAAIRKVGPPPTGAPVNQHPLTPAPVKPPSAPAPAPTAPTLPLLPPALYWYGWAMYLTNGRVRTQYGLRPAEADRYARRYRVLNRAGSPPGGPGGGYPLHDRMATVIRPELIAPVP
jgi:hypothetical protein